jgi:predicted Zn-dependent protease
MLVGIGAVLAIGAAIVFAGGALASWATPMIPHSVDTSIGEMSQKQMAASESECTNPAAQKYVEDLARPLIEAAGDVPFEFSFRVADTDQINAFCLPGGYVTVNRGLLEAAESGEEVAGVIGHEIQHALLRHGTKRVLRQLGSSVLLSLIFGGSDLHSVSQAASDMTALSYDRSQESEADLMGVELLVGAGIDPSGLSTFFERLSKDAVRPPELLSTHPDPGTRAEIVAEAAARGGFKKLPPPSSVSCHLKEEPAL